MGIHANSLQYLQAMFMGTMLFDYLKMGCNAWCYLHFKAFTIIRTIATQETTEFAMLLLSNHFDIDSEFSTEYTYH